MPEGRLGLLNEAAGDLTALLTLLDTQSHHSKILREKKKNVMIIHFQAHCKSWMGN